LQNYALAKYSLAKTIEVSRERHLDYDLSERGSLCIFDSPGDLEKRWAICQRLMELGLTAERLTRDEVANFQPSLGAVTPTLAGGIRFPDDARGDAHRFCRGLAQTIVNDGGEIRTGITVERVISEGGRVISLETNAGSISADRIVVAAGVWSPSLLKGIGVQVPVKPAKGFSITIEGVEQSEVPDVAVLDESSHAVVSTFGSRLRIVGMAEFCGFDKSIPRSRIDYLHGVLRKLLPELANSVEEHTSSEWAGLRPMSADGRPLIGTTSIKGLFLNTGHGALGWTLAMGSGNLLADVIAGLPPETDAVPFALDGRCR
jgi:D-amino-acid dehydrogenase